MDPVASIVSAMRADAEVLRVVSQNVANAQTPAYRREVPATYAAIDALVGTATSDATSTASRMHNDAPHVASSIDLRPGTLQSTGEPLHLAIEGAAFFVIGTEQGERLTRRGDLRIDSEGRMVTAAGQPVLGMNGAIHVREGQPIISADGAIRVGEVLVDRMRLVEVASAAGLRAEGDGVYALVEGEPPLETRAAQVRQGFLETSNVSSVDEMIRLMETMRHFEAAQRFIRGHDSMVGEAIATLGKV